MIPKSLVILGQIWVAILMLLGLITALCGDIPYGTFLLTWAAIILIQIYRPLDN